MSLLICLPYNSKYTSLPSAKPPDTPVELTPNPKQQHNNLPYSPSPSDVPVPPCTLIPQQTLCLHMLNWCMYHPQQLPYFSACPAMINIQYCPLPKSWTLPWNYHLTPSKQQHNNLPCSPSPIDTPVPPMLEKATWLCIKWPCTLTQSQINHLSQLTCLSSVHGPLCVPPPPAQKSTQYSKQAFKPPKLR